MADEVRSRSAQLGAKAPSIQTVETASSREDAAPALLRTAPASSGQERLWLSCQAGSAAYAVPIAYLAPTPLDPAQFKRAVAAMIRRFDALRTGLEWEHGRLRQKVYDRAEAAVTVEACADGAAFAKILNAVAAAPFDLSVPPLMRAVFSPLKTGGSGLGFVFHHAVCDSWSLELFMRDFTASYQSDPLTATVGDHVAWSGEERAWLTGEQRRSAEAYWRSRDLAASQPLGLGARRSVAATRRGDVVRFEAAPEHVGQLASAAGATPLAALAAAYFALLRRYSVNERINVALPIAGRNAPHEETIFGYLSNTIVVAERFSTETTFRALTASVFAHIAEGLEFGRLPFQDVVRVSKARRDRDPPIYDAMFGPQNTPVQITPQIDGHVLVRLPSHNGSAKCDLTLLVEVEAERIACELEYDSDLFDRSWADRFCQAYRLLLAAAAAGPDRPVDVAALLAEEARVTAFAERVDGARYDDPPAHILVEKRAAAAPEAVAIKWRGGAVTYGEMESRAEAIAWTLAARGLARGDRVGVLLDRGPDLVCALLGAMKVGIAFVPLDGRLPSARIAQICHDSGARAILTEAAYAGFDVPGVPALDVAALQSELGGGRAAAAVGPGDVAFIYYTSGSTGAPKGAPTDHRCLSIRLAYMREAYPLSAGEALLQKTPLIFDIAIWEIFLPLFAGGTVVILEAGDEADSGAIADLLTREPIPLVHFVPSALRAYLETVGARRYVGLRWVIASGEALPAELARRAREHFGAPVHGQYGQTESSEVALWETDLDVAPPGVAMLGRPIGAYSLYVVDAALQPVPDDVPGELCVSACGGLALGYLNRPRQTAECFLPHPCPSAPGQRLYRTGDLVRRRGDGAIEYLGRVDQQVKIHGCRVEPGEIEHVLHGHDGVADCVVVTCGDPAGETRLVAYVRLRGAGAGPKALADYVRDRLPWYMIPAAFVAVDALPRTMSGKIDRTRLPEPDRGAFLVSDTGAAPAGALETAVAQIWRQVLRMETLARDDDFFMLGGGSLAAMRVISSLNEQFGVALRIGDFMRHSTLAGLAARVEASIEVIVAAMPDDEVGAYLETLERGAADV